MFDVSTYYAAMMPAPMIIDTKLPERYQLLRPICKRAAGFTASEEEKFLVLLHISSAYLQISFCMLCHTALKISVAQDVREILIFSYSCYTLSLFTARPLQHHQIALIVEIESKAEFPRRV